MKTYIIKRVLIIVPLTFVMTFLVFVAINWSGNSAFDKYRMDPSVPHERIAREIQAEG